MHPTGATTVCLSTTLHLQVSLPVEQQHPPSTPLKLQTLQTVPTNTQEMSPVYILQVQLLLKIKSWIFKVDDGPANSPALHKGYRTTEPEL